jgi:hypothetical protein
LSDLARPNDGCFPHIDSGSSKTKNVNREHEPAETPLLDYVFEPQDVADVLAIAESPALTASDPLALALAIHDREKELRDELALELQVVLSYELEEDDNRPGSVELQARGFELPGLSLRELSEAPPDAHILWTGLLDATAAPLLAAQLADVLLMSRANSMPEHAERTINLYLAAGMANAPDRFHRTLCLMRASTITRTRSMHAAETRTRAVIIEAARASLEAESQAGITMRLLESLSVEPRAGWDPAELAEVSSLLDRAAGMYRDPHNADAVGACRRRLARDESERLAASHAQIDTYMAVIAQENNGILKMHWAEKAAELAARFQLPDRQAEAIRIMQNIPRDSMGWKVIESSVRIPRSALRHTVRKYRAVRGWRQAIATFLTSDSPIGSHEQNRKQSKEASRGSLRSLFGRSTFGVHGMPERTGTDFDKEELDRFETIVLRGRGMVLELELAEIGRRFGVIEHDELVAALMQLGGGDQGLAEAYADALNAHLRHEYSDSARLAIPLVEAGMRGLLLELNEPIYRVERGSSPGRFPAMDFYVDRLGALGLDIDWSRAIRIALLNEGTNMRNLFAHGYKLSFTAEESAIILRLAGLFVAMPIRGTEALADPVEAPRRKLRRRLGWIYF